MAVIILCWNNRQLLDECYQSLYNQTFSDFEILMVDNGSSDDSVEFTREHHSKVRVIETGQNLGFAIGNNVGIREALKDPACDYVVLLNTDATLRADWLEKMVAFAVAHPKGAGFQSLTLDYYDREVIDSVGILIDRNGLATQIAYRKSHLKLETRPVFGVNAAAALYSRRFLEAQPFGHDYLDHNLWMYLEDVDIAARAVMMGFENWFVNETEAYHMGSASTGGNPAFSMYMTYRNNLPVLVKNLPLSLIWRALPGMVRFDLARLRGFLRERRWSLISAVLRGRLVSLWRLPLFVTKRRLLKRRWQVRPEQVWALMAEPKFIKLKPVLPEFGAEPVTVIVPFRESILQLRECLAALEHQTYSNHHVLVIDNASGENLSDLPGNPEVLAQTENLGFANGLNVGITAALKAKPKPVYIAALAPQVKPAADWLEQLVKAIRTKTEALAVASRLEQDGHLAGLGLSLTRSGRIKPRLEDDQKSTEIMAASDWAMLLRVYYLDYVGLFDGDFFAFYEDLDFGLRGRLFGYPTLSAPAARATIGDRGSQIEDRANPPRTTTYDSRNPNYYWFHRIKNQHYIAVKNLPFKLFVKTRPTYWAASLREFGLAASQGGAWGFTKGELKALLKLPLMLAYRRDNQPRRIKRAREIEPWLDR